MEGCRINAFRRSPRIERTLALLAAVVVATLLASGIAVAKNFTCKAAGTCKGTQQSDVITGTNGVDPILGLRGRDRISARGGADTLNGGRQNDILNGGGGNDIYRMTSQDGPPGADRISADASGTDRVDFSQFDEIVSVGIAGPTIACPQDARVCLSLGGNFIENLTGTAFDDELFGSTRGNSMAGGDGNDGVVGATGNDVLHGQAGDDAVFGQDGNDLLTGGTGADDLVGEAGDDRLTGGTEADRLFGEDGRDQLEGQQGADTLVGQLGDDDLNGGTEDDGYFFDSNWGTDEVVDAGGAFDAVRITSEVPATSDTTVDLNAGPGPEIAGDGRVDWTQEIELVQVGLADDTFIQSPADNLMVDLGGNDTYGGYDGGGFGTDQVIDSAGTDDTLDLTAFDTADMSWAFAGDAGNVVGLSLRFPAGSTDGSRLIVRNYFQGSASDPCASIVGPGLIENLAFADDPEVTPEEARALIPGCPQGEGLAALTARRDPVDIVDKVPRRLAPVPTPPSPEEPPKLATPGANHR